MPCARMKLYALPLLMYLLGVPVRADTTQLAVTGRLPPPACTIELGTGGIAEFRIIPRQNILADSQTRVGTLPVSLRIRCPAPIRFAITANDNYRASANGFSPRMMTVIDETSRQTLGYYIAHLMPGKINGDGRPVRTLQRQAEGSWTSVLASALNAANGRGIGFAPAGAVQPAALTTLSGDIEVELVITRRRSGFPVGGETRISGSTTVQLIYL